MRAELHCHSNYSKGKRVVHEGLNTPKQIVEHARRIGLDIIAITDHDTADGGLAGYKYAHQKKKQIMVIPGEEISTDAGHILALGIQETIKPGLSLRESIDKIHEQGGIAVAAHPFDIERKGIGIISVICDAIEVFNAMDLERFANFRARRFQQKHGLPGIAGSDAHNIEMMGKGVTIINSDINDTNDIDSVFHAIKKGNVELITRYIKTSVLVDWLIRRYNLCYDDIINYIEKNYSAPSRFFAKGMMKLVKKSPGKVDYFFRALAYIGIVGSVGYSILKEINGMFR